MRFPTHHNREIDYDAKINKRWPRRGRDEHQRVEGKRGWIEREKWKSVELQSETERSRRLRKLLGN